MRERAVRTRNRAKAPQPQREQKGRAETARRKRVSLRGNTDRQNGRSAGRWRHSCRGFRRRDTQENPKSGWPGEIHFSGEADRGPSDSKKFSLGVGKLECSNSPDAARTCIVRQQSVLPETGFSKMSTSTGRILSSAAAAAAMTAPSGGVMLSPCSDCAIEAAAST